MKRVRTPERMEDPEVTGPPLRRALSSMDRFHDLLGTLSDLERVVERALVHADPPLTVCDVGAGSGHLGKRLHERHGDRIRYLRVEPSRRVIEVCPPRSWETVLRASCPGLPLSGGSVDVVVSSLVLHHVPDEQLSEFLRESRDLARVRVLHHDLVRSRWAHRFTWLFTRLFSGNPIARADGPLSVRRSRTREEWTDFLARNNLAGYDAQPRWPWRINLRAGVG